MIKFFFKRIYNLKTRNHDTMNIKVLNEGLVELGNGLLKAKGEIYCVKNVDFGTSGISIKLDNIGFDNFFIPYDKIMGVM